MNAETINNPQPRTILSPNTSTNFPEISPETNLTMAKLETIKPTSVFETPNVRAKIGIAGMINPNPIATKNEMVVKTETSRGSPVNGERIVRILSRSPLQRHPASPLSVLRYLATAFPSRKSQRRMPAQQLGTLPRRQIGMLT